jgi:hypothetical protein
MIRRNPHDPVLQNLGLLRRLSPDPQRAERVRARCRAHLERNQALERAAITGLARVIVAPLVVGCLCVLYIAGLVGVALRLQGMPE